jgi:hypothetical protein
LFVNENRNYWASSPNKSIPKVLRETGEIIMQVARLLPLNLNRWGSVIDTLTSVFEDIKQERVESFGITFLDTDFKPCPYLQATLNLNGDLLVELISNEYLVTKLNRWQESQVRLLGFKMPDENNPNYHRATQANEQPVYTARQLLEAARTVFEIKDDVWFTFGQSDYEKALAGSSAFWHNAIDDSRLCLPGTNVNSTKEGLRA